MDFPRALSDQALFEEAKKQMNLPTDTASPSYGWNPEDVSSPQASADTTGWLLGPWLRAPGADGEKGLAADLSSSSSCPTRYPFSLPELIEYTRIQLPVRFAGYLARRIEYLAEVSREDFPHQEPLSVESLEDLLFFLESNPKVRRPGLVLTLEGNIRAEWRKERNRFLGIEFTGGGNVRYVLFSPDPKHPEKTARVSGIASCDSVMDLVQPYNVSQWVLEGKDPAK